MDQPTISKLVAHQLERIEQLALRETIESLLVAPRTEAREWDYGAEGQKYDCWIVLHHRPSETVIAYCEHGFGPASPWGLLWARPEASMGMDAQWYTTLEDAVRESRAWEGPNPAGYEVG